MKKTQIVSAFVGGALAVVVVSATIIGFSTNDKKIVPTTTTITTTTQPVSETTTEPTTVPTTVQTTANTTVAPTVPSTVPTTEQTTAPTTEGTKYATREQYDKIQKGVTTYEEACEIFGFEGKALERIPENTDPNYVGYIWESAEHKRFRIYFSNNVVATGILAKTYGT